MTFQQIRSQPMPPGQQQRYGRRAGVAAGGTLGTPMGRRLPRIGGFVTNPFAGVEWSPAYAAFLAYTFAIVTYKLPIGTASMGLALLTLPLEPKPIRFPRVAVLTVALVGWALVGAMTTDYPELVIDGVTDFAKIALILFVGLNVMTTRARLRCFIVAWVIEWGMFPIRGALYTHFIAHADEQGRTAWNYIYSNPNDLGSLCILAIAISLGMIAVERKRWVVLGGWLAVATLLLVILLTQSRGAVVALAIFGLVVGRKYLRNVRAIAAAVIMLVGVAAIAPDSVWRRFSTIKDAANTNVESYDAEFVDDLSTRQDQASSVQRLEIWRVALAIMAENPITGVGVGAYPEAHFAMWRKGGFLVLARGRRDTHSTYLSLGAEEGIPGLLLFLALCGTVLADTRRARKKHAARAPELVLQLFNMEVGMYGYMVAGIWGSYGVWVPTYMHIMLLASFTTVLNEETDARPPTRRGAQQRVSGMRPRTAEASA